MKKKIAVLFGGTSSERKISIASGQSVLNSLLKSGLKAYPVDTKYYPIEKLKKEGFNKAYIVLHGKGGEDGSIQGALEHLKIPYTGSGIMASSIAIDKFRTKLLWKASNLPVIPDVYISKKKFQKTLNADLINKILKLGFPCLIKPNKQGSSIGIKLAYNIQDINESINNLFTYDNDVLIEKFIKGKEYTISILNQKILPSIHILFDKSFYDYDCKYKNSSTQYICPSGLKTEEEKKLKKISNLAWNIIGCSGCGRIDVILDSEKKFWLLEVNTIPGMTKRSLVPMAASQMGISFDELVLLILNKNY